MENYYCKKCGSLKVHMISNDSGQTGLYCSECNKWIKWVGKSEIPVVKMHIDEMAKCEVKLAIEEERNLEMDKEYKHIENEDISDEIEKIISNCDLSLTEVLGIISKVYDK